MGVLFGTGSAVYHAAVRVAALWHPKAKAWVRGREGLWERLERKASVLRGGLWMHCASVGEFEQGRPVLEAIKAERPELPVLLTFFSPSGYEARKNEPLATHVDYLPPDGKADAERLVQLIAPRAAVFVKYEFWYHHLHALNKAGVPTFLISALFRPDQPFFRWYGWDWRSMLRCFAHISTQDDASRLLLQQLGLQQVSTGGDTRYDRVVTIARHTEALPLAAAFKGDTPTVVCGSTWPADETLLRKAMAARRAKSIIVPHEPTEQHLTDIEAGFPRPLVRWSELEGTTPENIRATVGATPEGTLLVDRMGLLARLYRHGEVAYVGGGFGDGIHNLLEAAVWGRPVIMGPRHTKFPEAAGLLAAGAAAEVRNADELAAALRSLLDDPERWQRASDAAARYVQERIGATERVLQVLRPVL
ncbi:MAG TPA: glycosyltransferase N-terminal domain-containing protein [Flavobacteriales bacterium]